MAKPLAPHVSQRGKSLLAPLCFMGLDSCLHFHLKYNRKSEYHNDILSVPATRNQTLEREAPRSHCCQSSWKKDSPHPKRCLACCLSVQGLTVLIVLARWVWHKYLCHTQRARTVKIVSPCTERQQARHLLGWGVSCFQLLWQQWDFGASLQGLIPSGWHKHSRFYM